MLCICFYDLYEFDTRSLTQQSPMLYFQILFRPIGSNKCGQSNFGSLYALISKVQFIF